MNISQQSFKNCLICNKHLTINKVLSYEKDDKLREMEIITYCSSKCKKLLKDKEKLMIEKQKLQQKMTDLNYKLFEIDKNICLRNDNQDFNRFVNEILEECK